MASIHVLTYVLATIDGERYEFGSPSEAVAITAAGNQAFRQVFSVGTETTKKVFDVDADLPDFDFLLIASDQDVMLELVTDDDGEVGERAFTMGLKGSGTAGQYGVPIILPRDDSYANYTVNFAGGALDVIETIRVRNLSASLTAKVIVLAFT